MRKQFPSKLFSYLILTNMQFSKMQNKIYGSLVTIQYHTKHTNPLYPKFTGHWLRYSTTPNMLTLFTQSSHTKKKNVDIFAATFTCGEFNNASAFKRSLYWCQALHITNKDRYQSTSARRALALLNSPLVIAYVLILTIDTC